MTTSTRREVLKTAAALGAGLVTGVAALPPRLPKQRGGISVAIARPCLITCAITGTFASARAVACTGPFTRAISCALTGSRPCTGSRASCDRCISLQLDGALSADGIRRAIPIDIDQRR